MLEPDELTLAAEVRAKTEPDALFISGMENHDPVAMLTGRRIYVGYANWLWTEGIPYEARTERRPSGSTAPNRAARRAWRERGIDYVVIGPHERDGPRRGRGGVPARYPVLVQVGRVDRLRRAGRACRDGRCWSSG